MLSQRKNESRQLSRVDRSGIGTVKAARAGGLAEPLDADAISCCQDKNVLLAELKACAGDIVANLARMANIVRRLDELGVKIEIDHALLPYVRMIAKGQLSAACFAACSSNPALLTLAPKLDPEIQHKIATNQPFKLIEPSGRERTVRAVDLNKGDLAQMFVADRERTAHEKREWVDRTTKKPTARKDEHDPDASGPRPMFSAVSVEMNWAAKKVVAAAVAWDTALESDDEPEIENAYKALLDAVAEYKELGGP